MNLCIKTNVDPKTLKNCELKIPKHLPTGDVIMLRKSVKAN